MSTIIRTIFSSLSAIAVITTTAGVSAEVLTYAQSCAGAQCTVNVGDSAAIAMEIYDLQGNLAVVPASFVWTLTGIPGAGIGTQPNQISGTTLSLSSPVGISSVYLTIPSTIIPAGGQLTGQLEVVATYGGNTARRIFTVILTCDSEPTLYAARASATVTGTQATHTATAELLETCRPEYKLKNNIGERQ